MIYEYINENNKLLIMKIIDNINIINIYFINKLNIIIKLKSIIIKIELYEYNIYLLSIIIIKIELYEYNIYLHTIIIIKIELWI